MIGMSIDLDDQPPFIMRNKLLQLGFTQAYLGRTAFAFNLSWDTTTGNGGSGYMGDFTQIPSWPANNTFNWYPVGLDNERWSWPLYNVKFDTLDLGWNGYIIWDTVSPYSVVPQMALNTLISLMGLQGVVKVTKGNLTVATFNCVADSTPDLTFYFNVNPIIFGPAQYIIQDAIAGNCQLAFAGSNTVDPIDRAFTLGSIMMNHAYTIFDHQSKTLGYRRHVVV